MPNIEIHGFHCLNCSVNIKLKIEDIMQKLGLGEDAITSQMNGTIACSCDGKGSFKPYIRICSTDPEEIKRIVAAFRKAKLGVDVETLHLADFIPVEEMK